MNHQTPKETGNVSGRTTAYLRRARVGARITIVGLCITLTMGENATEYVEENFPTVTWLSRGLDAAEDVNSTVDDIGDDVDAIDCSISENFGLPECY
ncbi:hypothetical protein [Pseudooceanicola sp.]|uniref:hypothetical protein n=1 Tax=Pseudooceanicola sp. TaxID=1914328 RepID=UPI002636B2A9|nr:hypothetical protein [Pseudooceanicola sp.]MDF1854297.1 hypothetical protein [Pseudooceanicola sp.]